MGLPNPDQPDPSALLAARVAASTPQEQAGLDRLKSRTVMICTPIARAPVWRYTVALAETCVLLSRVGIPFHYNVVVGQSNLPRARNVLVARFLASDASDLMFIDDDIGWDQADVVRLLASDQPLLAGIYRRKIEQPNEVAGWSCQFLPGVAEGLNIDAMGNVEVARAATGFMRIQRQVFEEMIRAHPEWKGGGGQEELSPHEQPFYHRFFVYDDDEATEDYVFCDRWRAIGGRVFIDPSLTLSHVGEKAYTGAIKDLIWPSQRDETSSR
jgi:hypothetical protein